jgi:hypothetical protein
MPAWKNLSRVLAEGEEKILCLRPTLWSAEFKIFPTPEVKDSLKFIPERAIFSRFSKKRAPAG